MSEKKFDPVNQPKHYASLTPEPIDVIEGWGLGFHLGNAVKYIARAGKKDPSKEIEDLEKAAWYLARHIEKLMKKEFIYTRDSFCKICGAAKATNLEGRCRECFAEDTEEPAVKPNYPPPNGDWFCTICNSVIAPASERVPREAIEKHSQKCPSRLADFKTSPTSGAV